MTTKRIENWLYYNWWIPVLALLVLMVAGDILTSARNQDRSRADYRIAYVGYGTLSEQACTALEEAFSVLGTDVNGDGQVTVSLVQYIAGAQGSDGQAVYGSTAEIALLADITNAESYFYLLDDPQAFQRSFQLLAEPDGSPCAEDDFSIAHKAYPCRDIPALAGRLPDGLYLGRRCFPDPDARANSPENAALWKALTGGI